jgi:molecular chaperone HtpG
VSWYATGEEDYQVRPAELTERGTKVEIKLKEDAKEFADEYRLKNIIHKHSEYIGFPIYVGEDKQPVNKQTSIWRMSKQSVTEEQYKDFYKQLTLDFEDPLLHAHIITDAPVQLYALLYVPGKSERGVFALRREDGLKLYSRNILIDEYNKDLLPEHLRFVQGVVDSEDLPLNVSRETVQVTGLMARLKKVISGQIMKELELEGIWQLPEAGCGDQPSRRRKHLSTAALQDQPASRNLVLPGRLRRADEAGAEGHLFHCR